MQARSRAPAVLCTIQRPFSGCKRCDRHVTGARLGGAYALGAGPARHRLCRSSAACSAPLPPGRALPAASLAGGHLAPGTTADEVQQLFGSVAPCIVQLRRAGGRRAGGTASRYAFITFASPEEAAEAAQRLHHAQLRGSLLRVMPRLSAVAPGSQQGDAAQHEPACCVQLQVSRPRGTCGCLWAPREGNLGLYVRAARCSTAFGASGGAAGVTGVGHRQGRTAPRHVRSNARVTAFMRGMTAASRNARAPAVKVPSCTSPLFPCLCHVASAGTKLGCGFAATAAGRRRNRPGGVSHRGS